MLAGCSRKQKKIKKRTLKRGNEHKIMKTHARGRNINLRQDAAPSGRGVQRHLKRPTVQGYRKNAGETNFSNKPNGISVFPADLSPFIHACAARANMGSWRKNQYGSVKTRHSYLTGTLERRKYRKVWSCREAILTATPLDVQSARC